MASPNLGFRKIFIALATIGTLLVLAYYYFMVSVPGNESELRSRGFRILSRIEQNVTEKKVNVQKTLDLFFSKDKDVSSKEFFLDGLKFINKIDRKSWESEFKSNKFLSYFDRDKNKWTIRFFGTYYLHDSKGNPGRLSKDTILVYDYDIDRYLKDIVGYRKDFFDEYIILQNDSVIYQTNSLAFRGNKSYEHPRKRGRLFSDFVEGDTLAGKQYHVFYHPFDKSSDIKFVLCGLVLSQRYNSDKYLHDTEEVVWISIFFLLAALSLPFIKIFSVSRFERLGYYDVIRMGIALTAGVSIITVALQLWMYSNAELEKQKREVKQLNHKIKTKIESEVSEVLRELSVHEKNICSGVRDYENWINENASSPYNSSESVDQYFNLQNSKHYSEALLLIGSGGDNWGSWQQKNTGNPDPKLNEREYVKVFVDSTDDYLPYALRPDSSAQKRSQYFVQPIYSWLDQQNFVMVSKEADKTTKEVANKLQKDPDLNTHKRLNIIALETNLFSMMHTVLPDELNFCVLDEKGNVLFHSDDKRNLRENFIEESKEPFVNEAIVGRMDTTLEVRYYGTRQVTHISPLANLPYTVVTLCETSFYKDALVNQVTFSFSMLIILGLLLLLVMWVSHMITRRLTFLKRQNINLRWLRPTAINMKGFIRLLFYLLLPTVLSFFFYQDPDLLFISFILPLFTLGVAVSAIFKTQIQNYLNSFHEKKIDYQFRVFFVLCAATAFVIIAILAYYDFGALKNSYAIVGMLMFFIILLIAFRIDFYEDILSPALTKLWLGLEKLRYKKTDRKTNLHYGEADRNLTKILSLSLVDRIDLKVNKKFKLHFAIISALLLLYNVSIFPARNFFRVSVLEEIHIMKKRNSISIAGKTVERERWLLTHSGSMARYEDEEDSFKILRSGIYPFEDMDKNFAFITPGNLAKYKHDESKGKREKLTELYLRIVNLPNISYDPYELKGIFAHRYESADSDNSWFWDDKKQNLSYLFFSNFPSEQLLGVSIGWPPNKITSDRLTPGFKLLFVGIIVLVMIIIYCTLMYVYRKFLLIDYFPPENNLFEKRKKDTQYIIDNLTKEKSNLLVISLPGTNVIMMLEERLNECYEKIKSTTFDNNNRRIKDRDSSTAQFEKKEVTALLQATNIAREQSIGILTEETSQSSSNGSGNNENDEIGKMLTAVGIENAIFKRKNLTANQAEKIILLPFFDLKASDVKSCDERICALAKCFHQNNSKVIWVTSSDPCEQISIMKKNILQVYKMKRQNKDPMADEIYNPEQEQEKMLKILDDFEKVTYSLEDNWPPTTSRGHVNLKYMEDEFRFGAYFNKLRINAVKNITETFFKKTNTNPVRWVLKQPYSDELFVLKIQDIAQNYFYSVWTSLSSKEKYVLYDLASDELTNYKNYIVLAELERKGVLFFCDKENTLKIFNKSFRNFILTVVNPEEALLLEKQVNVSGTWEIVRMVLVIFFVSIGMFLFFTENTAFNKIIGAVTAVSSLIPAIINFFTNIKGAKLSG